jgi:hypothetical protein
VGFQRPGTNAAAPALAKANNQEGCELTQRWGHAKHASRRTNQGVEVVWKGRQYPVVDEAT